MSCWATAFASTLYPPSKKLRKDEQCIYFASVAIIARALLFTVLGACPSRQLTVGSDVLLESAVCDHRKAVIYAALLPVAEAATRRTDRFFSIQASTSDLSHPTARSVRGTGAGNSRVLIFA
jgi:hypothetical protein